MKVKVGTQLEDEVFRELKMTALQEKRAVGELIQSAVCDYLNRKKRTAGHRSGLRRFLDSPAFKLTDEQFRETMQADYYDQ
jgi:predicted transcriptional regulator